MTIVKIRLNIFMLQRHFSAGKILKHVISYKNSIEIIPVTHRPMYLFLDGFTNLASF